MKYKILFIVLFVLSLGVQANVVPLTNMRTDKITNSMADPLGKVTSTVTTVSLSDSNVASYASSGSGTSSSPYVISNLVLGNSSNSGLSIVNMNSYYLTIQNITTYNNLEGVYIVNCTHITFTQINSYGNTYGMYIYKSSYLSITSSSFYGNANSGLDLSSDSIINIDSTSVYNNPTWGLQISNSKSITVTNGNYSYNTQAGIEISGTGLNNIINNNVFQNNVYNGVYLYGTTDLVTITNNVMKNQYSGILFSSASNNIAQGNTLTANTNGVEIKGSANNNIVDSNTVSTNNFGVRVHDLSTNNTIQKNTFSNSVNDSISITNSSQNKILANSFSSPGQAEINITTLANNTVISDNTFASAPIAITANNITGLMVSSNTFTNTNDGLDASHSNDVTFFNNSYTINGWSTGTEAGTRLTSVNGFKILHNFYYNSFEGLVISYSSNGSVSYNKFTTMYSYSYDITYSSKITLSREYVYNTYYSEFKIASDSNIKIEYSYFSHPNSGTFFWEGFDSTMSITHNYFYTAGSFAYFYYPNLITFSENTFYTPVDPVTGSFYSSTVVFSYNYYNTYTGNDTNHDGIGDIPNYLKYQFYDAYPLMNPTSLQVNSTSNQILEQNSVNNKVSFDFSGFFNFTYVIKVNSSVQSSGSFYQGQLSNVAITLDSSQLQTFNVTVILKDQYQYTRVFTKMVQIIPSTGPVITGPSTYTFDGSNALVQWNVSDLSPQSVALFLNNTSIYNGTLSTSGNISFPLSLALTNGTYVITVVATDQDGLSTQFNTTLTVAIPENIVIVPTTTTITTIFNSTSTVTTSSNSASGTGTSSSSVTNTSSSTKSSPGFEILFTVVGLVAVVIAGKRRFK